MSDFSGRRGEFATEPALSNPFCTRFTRPGAVAFRDPASGGEALADDQQLLGRLARCRRGLIIGPHGSGKSTLVQSLWPALRERFHEVALVRLSAPPSSGLTVRWRQQRASARRVGRRQAELSEGDLLVVDGIEQLSRPARLGVLATAARRRHHLLATSHSRLGGFREVYRTRVTPRLIESLAESLLAGASVPVERAVRRELARRDLSGVSNVRDLWFEMYDTAAKIEADSTRRLE